MAFTTKDIPNWYSPPDDPTLVLSATLFIPDPAVWPGPYPCFVGTQTPGFGGDGGLGGPFQAFGGNGHLDQAIVEKGIVCLAFQARSDDILPGQMTDGKYPTQEEDCKAAIRYMRPGAEIETIHGFTVTGFVGIIGGSGSAEHAFYQCVTGTTGDDKADAGVPLSPPTDYSNRNNVTQPFITTSAFYAGFAEDDLDNLRSVSPIAQDLANASPILHYNGDHEAMPLSQLTDIEDDMVAAGAVGYEAIINTGSLGGIHSFKMWPSVAQHVLDWIVARIAEFDGTEPPPPPEPTGRVKVTAVITDLAPGQALTLNVSAIDTTSNLEGPVTGFDFISDRADTGGTVKVAPVGVYSIVDATEGVINGDITTRAWLGFAYVDGGMLPTTWAALNPTSRDSFDWSQTDAFLAALFDNDKLGGISVSMGIKNPLWIYGGSHAVPGVFVNGPNSGTIPIPWSPNYLNVVKRFIIEFATRYDTHPNLSYITVSGLGQLLETLLVQQPADYDNLNASAIAAGYADLITAWRATSTGIMDIWIKAFRTTLCYLPIELPVPAIDGGLTGIDEFTRTSIQHYKSRFGVSNLQLDGLTAAGSDLSLNSIMRDANQSPRYYRFLRPSSDPACDPSQLGTYDPELGLRNAANAGITIGAQMEEFYEEDTLNVTGDYPADFATFQTDLTANAV